MITSNLEKFSVLKIRLRELRTQFGFSQKVVAERLGISYQSYQAYELGVSLPSLENFLKLTQIFECSADYLLGLSDY
ncbi:MAG: helix-turn-helix transcriptional regulator [Clostridia bacterium]